MLIQPSGCVGHLLMLYKIWLEEMSYRCMVRLQIIQSLLRFYHRLCEQFSISLNLFSLISFFFYLYALISFHHFNKMFYSLSLKNLLHIWINHKSNDSTLLIRENAEALRNSERSPRVGIGFGLQNPFHNVSINVVAQSKAKAQKMVSIVSKTVSLIISQSTMEGKSLKKGVQLTISSPLIVACDVLGVILVELFSWVVCVCLFQF